MKSHSVFLVGGSDRAQLTQCLLKKICLLLYGKQKLSRNQKALVLNLYYGKEGKIMMPVGDWVMTEGKRRCVS